MPDEPFQGPVVLGPPSAEWVAEAQLRIADRERQRFARILHNGLKQTLSGAHLMASVLEKQMRTAAPEHLDQIRLLNQQLRELTLALRQITEAPAEYPTDKQE